MESNNNLQNVTAISQLPSKNTYNNDQLVQQIQSSDNNQNVVLRKTEIISEKQNELSQIQKQIYPENFNQNNTNQNIVVNQENNNYNELINQLQKASASGATGLPSRDIPINPTIVANDNEVKPNYIPQQEAMQDYIRNMETPQDLITNNNYQQKQIDNLELFYSEFQVPVLVFVLYFLFQLPIFKIFIKKGLPSLFGGDGNPNLYGYIFNSALFSIIFYLLLKVISNLTSIL